VVQEVDPAEKPKEIETLKANLVTASKSRESCLSLARSLFYYTLDADVIRKKAVILRDIAGIPAEYIHPCTFPGAEYLTYAVNPAIPERCGNKLSIKGAKGSNDDSRIMADTVRFGYWVTGNGTLPDITVTVSASYPRIESAGTKLLNAIDEDLFNRLILCLSSPDLEICKWCSLIICNIIRSVSRADFEKRHSQQSWMSDVFRVKDPVVQLYALESLFGHHVATREISAEMLDLFIKIGLEDLFIELLSSTDEQLFMLARVVMVELLKYQGQVVTQDFDVDRLLLQCLDVDVSHNRKVNSLVVRQALDELSIRSANPDVYERIVEKGVSAAVLTLSYFQKIVSVTDMASVNVVISAGTLLLNLLRTETALRSMFNLQGIESLEVVGKLSCLSSDLGLKGSNNPELIQAIDRLDRLAIELLDRVFSKHADGPMTSNAVPTRSHGFNSVVPGSRMIDDVTLPSYFKISREDEDDLKNKRSKSKTLAIGTKHRNDAQFGLSFWILPQQMGNDDGVPIFYKGRFSSQLRNPDKANCTVKADVIVLDKKVYFEVAYNVQTSAGITVGWTSAKLSSSFNDSLDYYEVNGNCQEAYSLQVGEYCGIRLCWGGFSYPISLADRSLTPGCIIGAALDSNNSMSFYLNNSPIGEIFSASRHGMTAGVTKTDDRIKEGAIGADWSLGFTPFVTLSPGTEVDINFGWEGSNDMYFPSAEFISLRRYHEVANITQFPPTLLSRGSAGNWEPIRKGSSGLLVESAKDTQESMSLSLLQNMRLCFKVGSKVDSTESDEGDAKSAEARQLSYVCNQALPVNEWTHCLLRVDEDSVDFIINGIEDSVHEFGEVTVFINEYPFGIGLGPVNFNSKGRIWVSDFRAYDRAVASTEILSDGMLPYSINCGQRAMTYLGQNNGAKCFSALKNASTDDTTSRRINSLCSVARRVVLQCIWMSEQRGKPRSYSGLASGTSKPAIEITASEVEELLLAILDDLSSANLDPSQTDENKALKLELSYLVYRLSRTTIGRSAILRLNLFVKILSLSLVGDTATDFDTHFYLEMALCNIQSTSTWGGSSIYFEAAEQMEVQPFMDSEEYRQVWRRLPPLIGALSKNSSVLNKMGPAIVSSLRTKNWSEFGLDETKISALVNWFVSVTKILTSKVEKGTVVEVSPSNHPYDNNENVYGTVACPGALSLSCKWDEQCSTERRFDYLQLATDKDCKSVLPVGPNADGLFSGPNSDGWHKENLTVSADTFHWYWHSDGTFHFNQTLLQLIPVVCRFRD
jgi:hypothetical protein